MCVKFETSDNILEWSCNIFQNTLTSELFCYSRRVQGEKMNPIEAELDAIDRINSLKEAHRELGITKSPRFYDYAKLSIMEMNDLGLTSTEEHFFKDTNGDNIVISFN